MIACLKTSRIERGAASWHTTKPGVNPLKVKKKHAVSPDLRVYGKFGNATNTAGIEKGCLWKFHQGITANLTMIYCCLKCYMLHF